LADETERLGYPISRAAIANYESGRKRGLDIAELLVIAGALRIPPVALLFPQLPDGPVEVLPGTETSSWEAAGWFSGEESSPQPDDQPWPTTRESELVRAVRDRSDKLLSAAQLYQLFTDFAAQRQDKRSPLVIFDENLRAFGEQARTITRELNRLEQLIRESGGVINGGEPEAAATEVRRQRAKMQRIARQGERDPSVLPQSASAPDADKDGCL
jgi:transcriptional regulator with XRE-family HTH domain